MRRSFLLGVLLAAAPSSAADPMRDAVGLVRPVPADLRSQAFAAPRGDKAVSQQFWETIWRLERQRAALGGDYAQQTGRVDLVEEIRKDLATLPPEQAKETMVRFLRISHHYRHSQKPDSPESVRDFHENRFLGDVTDFASLARRAYLENNDQTYLNIFAHVRALASAGPEGLALSQALARIDPSNAVVQRQLAQDFLNASRHDQAVAAAEKAARLDPNDPRPLTTIASAKFAQDDFRGAYDAASKALRLDPGDKVAYSVQKLSRSHVAQESERPASPAWNEAEGEPFSQTASAAQPLPGADARRLERGADEARQRASVKHSELARLELQKGDYGKAVQLASRAIEADPRNAAAFYRRAAAYTRLKDYGKALADTTAAMKLMGAEPSPVLVALHARLLNKHQRYTEALSAADAGLAAGTESTPLMAQLLYQKAWALSGMGRRKDAIHALAQAARLDSRFIPYYQEALEMPAEGDLTALFSGELLNDVRDAPKTESLLSGSRMTTIMLLTLFGGFLLALGFMHVMGGRPSLATASGGVVDMAPPDDGLIAGTFRLQRKIGQGGMGVVHEALDVHLDRRVAIKKMRDEISEDPRERDRFLREARTVAALRHPSIVEIYSVVGDPAGIYLVFEFVDGHTVTDYIRHYKRLPGKQALRVVQGMAAALEYAHKRGIIHRDLKPSNVMITRDGKVKVMDFGVARHAKDTLSQKFTNTITGTPPYMAPEQEEGRVCKESDVYSMAVCLYEMVTGQMPFTGTGAGMMLAKLNGQYVRASRYAPELGDGFDQALAWGLAPNPADRCPSPERFVAAVAASLA